MKTDKPEQLLRDLLPGDELSAFRRESLALGLAALKTRRQRRRILRTAAATGLVLVFASGLVWHLTRSPLTGPRPPSRESARAPLPSIPAVATFISDEELLSLFPNRALALIGKPGHQRLLFLDQQPTSAYQ